MKNSKYNLLLALTLCLSSFSFAGNGDRAAQAGANELLINPWARSSGFATANIASVRGVEALYGNVAGSAFTKKTELVFSRTSWLKGSDININAFGLTQRIGESGVMGIGIMSMSFGDIDVTTTENPEGGLGKFSPSLTNMSLSYAKEFSHSIYGGVNVKVISESISNVSAEGVALDAGIQYIAGKFDNIKFGISLKNVGPTMRFGGNGLTEKFSKTTAGQTYQLTMTHGSEQFELPSQLNIGGSYDYKISDMHHLTGAATFSSNSFTNDMYSLGLEYGFRSYLMVRGGWTFVGKENVTDLTSNTYYGPAAGFTFELPFGKTGRTFGIDYSFRATNYFQGTHSIGARLSL
jgi:hypothetical protein